MYVLYMFLAMVLGAPVAALFYCVIWSILMGGEPPSDNPFR